MNFVKTVMSLSKSNFKNMSKDEITTLNSCKIFWTGWVRNDSF